MTMNYLYTIYLLVLKRKSKGVSGILSRGVPFRGVIDETGGTFYSVVRTVVDLIKGEGSLLSLQVFPPPLWGVHDTSRPVQEVRGTYDYTKHLSLTREKKRYKDSNKMYYETRIP